MYSVMKRLFCLIALSSMVLSCSKDSEPHRAEIYPAQIIGHWKLIYFHARPWDSYVHNFTDDNIIYTFEPAGILVVNGDGQQVPHADGKHHYFFDEGIIDGQNEKGVTVKIDDQEWLCSFVDGQLRISQTHVDGEALVFIRE